MGQKLGQAYVGTSGWAYREWRGKFYPPGLVQRRELAYLAERVPTVEMNSPFYRLQNARIYEGWASQVPQSFTFSIKGWRAVTHYRKLRDADQAVSEFFGSGILGLGKKLGPILWQLPPSLKFAPGLLSDFLGGLPKTVGQAAARAGVPVEDAVADVRLRYAVEPRNATFEDGTAYAELEAGGAALVMADSAGRHPEFTGVTADFLYVRLHGSPRMYYSNYSPEALEGWASVLKGNLLEGRDCYVYFDNTAAGHAPANALALAALLQDGPG